ncbi:EPIDERMAL PATTERNING FACTOR-like protein 2 [Lotus japonicus]|uniref:EPIDERMAL PATTERNING FACTOR-like protein 2 n=1 Tax=Lotus japonicus TaxID=34305 RepID=UPI00258C48E7|nr:EPIDERMAL PATTERNING FACTOR-like protein 2 [Lotus japonicus]
MRFHHHVIGCQRLGFVCISLFFLIFSSWIQQGLLVTEGRKTHNKQSGFDQKVSEDNKMLLRAQIGSRPPKCERRCRSCGHCEAIQVPTNPQVQNGKINSSKFSRIAYAKGDYSSNYKPMSWKCKCGNLIFNP